MTKPQNLQSDIFEPLLPFADVTIEPQLQKIDQALADDPAILRELYDIISQRHPFSKTLGRHSTAVETVLRMLIIRHYFNWSYRDTERWVKDSFSLRQFVRVYFDKVPHYSVLSRYEKRFISILVDNFLCWTFDNISIIFCSKYVIYLFIK